jgi:D-sedoheptulose 7-phosphate isomerase
MRDKTLNILNQLFVGYPSLKCCEESVVQSTQMMIDCFNEGGKLLTCGNGGSAADAQHIVGELMKAFMLPRKMGEKQKKIIQAVFPKDAQYLMDNLQGALPAMSLVGETALTTAYANDIASDLGFAQQVYGYGKKGDVLLGISTSGNSRNVFYAAMVAKTMDVKVIGMTGKKGGKLSDLCDELIAVPGNTTFRIQEYHLPVYHAMCQALENEFFGV